MQRCLDWLLCVADEANGGFVGRARRQAVHACKRELGKGDSSRVKEFRAGSRALKGLPCSWSMVTMVGHWDSSDEN